MPSFADILPPGSSTINDGNVVFLDYRKDRSTTHDHALAGLVEGMERMQEDPLVQLVICAKDTKSLAEQIREKGTGSVDLDIHKGCGGYTKVVMTGWKGCAVDSGSPHGSGDPGEEYGVKIEFIPKGLGAGHEEGEVEHPGGSKVVGAVLRNHTSYLYEVHDGNDKMYVHGMRRVTAQVCWWLCTHRSDIGSACVPIVPPGITVDECIDVISAMELESSMPTMPEREEDANSPFSRNKKGLRRLRAHTTLLDAKEASDEVKRMNIKEVEPIPSTIAAHEGKKVSVYPSGMLGFRQMQGIPGCVDAIDFIQKSSRRGGGNPPLHTRESAARAVCGAMCALKRDSSSDRFGVYRGNSGREAGREADRVYFLEDIECDEMHHYAKEVTSTPPISHRIQWQSPAPAALGRE